MQAQRNRFDLRDHPGYDAAGAHIARYDGTWGDHGESAPAHRNEPYSVHSGPGRVRVEYHAEFAQGSPFRLTLEGPWGPDADATMTREEADELRRLLEVMLLDSDPEWHAHNDRVQAEINAEGDYPSPDTAWRVAQRALNGEARS